MRKILELNFSEDWDWGTGHQPAGIYLFFISKAGNIALSRKFLTIESFRIKKLSQVPAFDMRPLDYHFLVLTQSMLRCAVTVHHVQ
jgi:hypothetical protein